MGRKTIKVDKIVPEGDILEINAQIIGATGIQYKSQWDNLPGGGDINYTGGNVGINTTSPQANLHVEGGTFLSSDVEVGQANLFVDTQSSRVGVGTTTPDATLHVEGNVYASSNIGIGTKIPQYTLDVHGTANVGALTANTISGDGYLLSNILASAVVGGVGLWTINESDNTIYYQTANVAIGKTNPTTTLDVDGTVTATEFSGPLTGRAVISTNADNSTNVYVTSENNQTTNPRRLVLSPEVSTTGNRALYSDNAVRYDAVGGLLYAPGFSGIGSSLTNLSLDNIPLLVGDKVRIGSGAGETAQGNFAIAIGKNAGNENQHQSTIILNASGTALNSQATNRFYVKPVRRVGLVTSNVLAYTGTNEIIEQTSVRFDSSGNTYVSSNLEVGQANLFVNTLTSNVGIGKTDPGFTLDVVGDINFSGQLYRGSSRFVSTPWEIETSPDALSYTNGNVGIGAPNPSANLHVTGNAYVSSNLEVGQANLFVNTLTSNVGIGKTDPGFTLDVVGDINFSGQLYQGDSQFVSTPWEIETSPDALSYTTGNVGIGASNPSANLHVTGNAYVSSNLEVGLANLFVDTTTTRVGIGKTDPAEALDVVGNIQATGDVVGFSDRRLKSKIERIEGALDKVCALSGYTFMMNDKPSTGLIAQEVLEVLPEAVHGSEETQYSLAYGNMIGLLVEAVKELRALI